MLTEVSVEQLKTQFVDSNKISQKDFDEITNTTSKTAYITWLAKKVVDKFIKAEDIYKFKKYFNIFDRRKREYPFADINQYKTQNDLSQLIKKSVEIANKESEDVSQQKGVSKKDKYKEFYIGSVDGFDVYELPQGRKDLYGVSCELGSGTEWCTATGNTRDHFDEYILKGPLFIFIKSNEKYQFSYETTSFMDKNDEDIIKKDKLNLFRFIEYYNPKYRVPLELKILNDEEHITNKDLKINGNLYLGYSDIESLPDGLEVSGNLQLGNSYIKSLPDGLEVGGWLDLHNSYIKSLPDGLKVGGGLSVNNCKYIESLPDNLKVGGRLNLKNTKIKIFPLGLEVESDIYADNSEITIILSDIKVKGNVNLKNTPISKKYTEAQLKQMCPGIEGEIIYDQIN